MRQKKKTRLCAMARALAIGSLVMLSSCDEMFREHCFYTGQLLAENFYGLNPGEPRPKDMELHHYVENLEQEGTNEFQKKAFSNDTLLETLPIGTFSLLSCNRPEGTVLYEGARPSDATIEVVTEPSSLLSPSHEVIRRSAGYCFGRAATAHILQDDTVYVDFEQRPLIQELKIRAIVDGLTLNHPDIMCKALLPAVYRGKRIAQNTAYGGSLPFEVDFGLSEREGEENDTFIFTSDNYIFGIDSSVQQTVLFRLLDDSFQGDAYVDLGKELSGWTSNSREITVHLTLGSGMEIEDVRVDPWVDRDFDSHVLIPVID